jgi:LacI family transcriptional regulator
MNPNDPMAVGPGRRRIGVRDLARLAQVSVGTVDRALHGRKEVSAKTRERILRLARQLDYKPDAHARALSLRRSQVMVAVCIPREIHFFYDQLRDGIFEEAARYRHLGLEIRYEPVAELGANEMVGLVADLIKTGIQALIMTPGNPEQLTALIDEAERDRNIRVVCVASDDSLSGRSTAISVEPRMNGMLAAELMAGFVPPGSRVAVITGSLATEDHAKKVGGFYEVFPKDCPGGKIVEVIEGHENEAKTLEICAALLEKEPKLAGLYVSTVNCLPVCRALEEAGRAGKVRVVATDLFAEAVPYFRNHTISASIYQRPYRQGQLAVRLIVDHFVAGTELPFVRYLNPAIVMRSNLKLFREIARSKSETHSRV